MCCNAFGLGALNVFWIIFGLAMALMNGMSYDCATSMAMFSGTTHECGSLENFLNGQWVLGFEGYFAGHRPRAHAEVCEGLSAGRQQGGDDDLQRNLCHHDGGVVAGVLRTPSSSTGRRWTRRSHSP